MVFYNCKVGGGGEGGKFVPPTIQTSVKFLDFEWSNIFALFGRITFNPLNPKIIINWNSHLLPLFISYRSSGEKLIKYQANSSCVIMSVILMTTLFYKALILQGEIWWWSLLGLKGLNLVSFPMLRPSLQKCRWIMAYCSLSKVEKENGEGSYYRSEKVLRAA